MIRLPTYFAFACALTVACGPAGQRTPSGPLAFMMYPPRDLANARPKTRPERSGFNETSTSADVMAFIDTLKNVSREIHVLSMGSSTQGKDIPVVILSRPLVRSASEAKRTNRPIVYIQANIHGGEVAGKEALLSLLRDLARDRFENVVDSLIIVAVPIYNPDGNDAMGPQEENRPSQRGPALVGRRANGQGLDLNRDYIKAEAVETRAALAFLRELDPDVFIDLHTTDGSLHGYDITYAPPLNPAARFSGPFTGDTILPALRASLRRNLRIESFPYGNVVSQDSVERGWFTYDHRPRFGTNYYGLRGRMAILAEVYSHDPFQQRIGSTYSFLMELLSLVAANALDILEVGLEADRRTTAWATTPGSSPALAIRSRITSTSRVEDVLVEEIERTGDSVRTEPGLRPGIRRTGRVRSVKIPVYDRFDPTLVQPLPYAWLIPSELRPVLEPLRRHGIFVEQLGQAATLAVERFTIDSLIRSPRAFQGHNETRLEGRWSARNGDSLSMPAGTYVVRGGQPLGVLALYLLEPLSDDGLVTWNFLDEWLRVGEAFPIARVMNRIAAPLSPVQD